MEQPRAIRIRIETRADAMAALTEDVRQLRYTAQMLSHRGAYKLAEKLTTLLVEWQAQIDRMNAHQAEDVLKLAMAETIADIPEGEARALDGNR